jgi:archaeal flagellin FlaB
MLLHPFVTQGYWIIQCPLSNEGIIMKASKHNDEGFTGLEAAIVLIAFVVVAAVFSYVVLGAGFFTTQKAQETVYKGVEQSTTNIQMIGQVYGLSNNTAAGIDQIRFTIGLAPGAPSINLEKLNIIVSTPTYGPTTLTWVNATSPVKDKQFVVLKNGDTTIGAQSTMSAGDQMEIRFIVTEIPKDTRLNVEMRPAVGAALPFSKSTPPAIQTNNVLN